jgi:hypothetical protein
MSSNIFVASVLSAILSFFGWQAPTKAPNIPIDSIVGQEVRQSENDIFKSSSAYQDHRSTQSPQNNVVLDTQKAKSYKNEKFGFEFKYPTSGYVLDETRRESAGFNTVVTLSVSPTPIEFGANFSVGVKTADLATNLEGFAKKLFGSNFINAEAVRVNNASWLKVRTRDDYFEKEVSVNYFAQQGNKIYRIYYFPIGSPNNEEDFAKVFTSFRFFTPVETPSTVSSFKLHTRIKPNNSGIPLIYYSATGSGVIPESRFSFWSIQITCPAGVTISDLQNVNVCGKEQRVRAGAELGVLIKNLTNQIQEISATGRLLSEKDGSTIASDTIAISMNPTATVNSSIRINTPLPNTRWKIGSTQAIQWVTMPETSANEKVYISVVGGSENIQYAIASAIPNTGSFSWSVGQYTYNSITNVAGGTVPPGSYQLKVEISGAERSVTPVILEKMDAQSPFTLLFGDNVFLAPNDGSLTLPTIDPNSGKGGGVQTDSVMPTVVSKAFYDSHQDIYDFLIILAPTFISPGFDGNSLVKNSVQGIGAPVNDASSLYGSNGTLKSVISIYNIESSLAEFIHEISHQWLMYISNANLKINRDGAHWSQFMDTATREGGYMYFSPNGGNPFIDNGDGTFSLDSSTPLPLTSYHKFNSMELYLMGFVPSSQVSPLTLWQTDSTQVAQTMRGTKHMITIQNIVDIIGQRNPAYPNTQREFKIAYIVLPKKGETIDSGTIDKIKQIVTNLPKEWSAATKGLSIIK